MANCHNCNAEVKSHPNKKEGIPYFCKERDCQRAYHGFRNKRLSGALLTDKCSKCGDAIRAGANYCKACRKINTDYFNQGKVRGEVPVGLRDPMLALVKWIDCKTCRWSSHCTERVKVGMWVACEEADARDKLNLELSPERGRMMELIEEARVM